MAFVSLVLLRLKLGISILRSFSCTTLLPVAGGVEEGEAGCEKTKDPCMAKMTMNQMDPVCCFTEGLMP